MLISANPGLNFNPGFDISLFKSRFGIILPIVFRAEIKLNLLFNLSDLKSDFTLTPGYLNPALNKIQDSPSEVISFPVGVQRSPRD